MLVYQRVTPFWDSETILVDEHPVPEYFFSPLPAGPQNEQIQD